MTHEITQLLARRVWDSRGRPTVEVEAHAGPYRGRAIAPAGASRGDAEATDLRDGGTSLGGYDVQHALATLHSLVAPAVVGRDADDLAGLDAVLDSLDPSPTREVVGGNVTVATSLAVLHLAAACAGVPVWQHLGPAATRLPRPEIQIIGGGAHAARRVDVQDFMVIPLSATRMDEALVQVAEVYLGVGAVLAGRGPVLGVADEGGHWPAVQGTRDALDVLTAGIERAGLRPGVDIGISIDVAASEFARDGRYHLAAEGRVYERDEWLAVLADWAASYPIVALEDPASEHDPEGMRGATARLGRTNLIIGDDFLVTDAGRIEAAAAQGACNSALIKVNQTGTVTRAAAAVAAARSAGWSTVVSARSGETEDVSVAHLSVGWAADLVKVGSITRGERTAKWNELLRIDEALGGVPLAPFPLGTSIPQPA